MIMILMGANELNIGGMETHGKYFVEHFKRREKLIIVTKRGDEFSVADGVDVKLSDEADFFIGIAKYAPTVLFFNDGHFIEQLAHLRKIFPEAMFVMRSGGNEFMKAPCRDMTLDLQLRRRIWSTSINENLDFIIANSAYTWQRMKAVGIDPARILIIRGGIELQACRNNHAQKDLLRRQFDELHGTEGKFIFCIAARHVKFKGIAETLKVLKRLYERRKYFLLIVGQGEETASLMKYCDENFSSGDYWFAGAVDNETALKYIALSDCVLNCSLEFMRESGSDKYIHTETMGRTILEAICQEVPVIATDAGGTREWFDEIPDIGELLTNGLDDYAPAVLERAVDDKMPRPAAERALLKYDWGFIFGVLYAHLFEQKRLKRKISLCCDLEGSVLHSFLSHDENVAVLRYLIALASTDCEIIFNSVGDFKEIVQRYPIIFEHLNEITVIANGGEVICVHGQSDIFWCEYHQIQPDIKDAEIDAVAAEIINGGLTLKKIRRVDKLYVNFKVVGSKEQLRAVVDALSAKCDGTRHFIVNNDENIKLISHIVNKGSALAYLRNYRLDCRKMIGVGNNVLDKLFLKCCDVAYMVNGFDAACESVTVNDARQAEKFLNRLSREVNQAL